jgi:fructose-bisphosphate aldolase class I
MNMQQLERMHTGKGFIAALDQSGGSTPKALSLYGIAEGSYRGEDDMYRLVHEMRSRIITSPAFNGEHILGAILFEDTMRRDIEGLPTADYLWQKKQIIPFIKVDKGLEELRDGVQLMKPMPGLSALLTEARNKHIFGTKMRSFIKSANPTGIAAVVKQQFDFARQIAEAGLVPIIEPETDIHAADREEAERLLKAEVEKHLKALDSNAKVIFKFSIPVQDNLYADIINDSRVVRVVALSGGYPRDEANARLARNKGMIASFSRALSQDLNAGQSDKAFDDALAQAVNSIYAASIS